MPKKKRTDRTKRNAFSVPDPRDVEFVIFSPSGLVWATAIGLVLIFAHGWITAGPECGPRLFERFLGPPNGATAPSEEGQAETIPMLDGITRALQLDSGDPPGTETAPTCGQNIQSEDLY